MKTVSEHYNEVSRSAIRRAQIAATDSAAAATEAKRIYGSSRGMWKAIQSRAIGLLEIANENGLSIERPTIERGGMVYGLVFMAADGQHLQPLYDSTYSRRQFKPLEVQP